MTLETFIDKLRNTPEQIDFSETIQTIDRLYDFTPTTFVNGTITNKAGENSGSCKVFAFALEQQLSKEEALACFGQYYFKDVLENPTAENHQNIRNFIQSGFEGLSFENKALTQILN